MQFGFNKENLSRTLWHLAVVAGAAAILAVLNALEGMDLDPKTLAVLALVSPILKTVVESVRKS